MCTDTTWQYLDGTKGTKIFGTTNPGYLDGATPSDLGNYIRTDQGLDTTEVSPALILDPELKETQYIVEIDSRFGKLYDKKGATGATVAAANPSFIDDDSIASYYFTLGQGQYVQESATGKKDEGDGLAEKETIEGPRGTRLVFGVMAAIDLVSSNYLFTTLGTSVTHFSNTWYFIDTTIRITGVTTGYRLDLPVRFLKIDA